MDFRCIWSEHAIAHLSFPSLMSSKINLIKLDKICQKHIYPKKKKKKNCLLCLTHTTLVKPVNFAMKTYEEIYTEVQVMKTIIE